MMIISKYIKRVYAILKFKVNALFKYTATWMIIVIIMIII